MVIAASYGNSDIATKEDLEHFGGNTCRGYESCLQTDSSSKKKDRLQGLLTPILLAWHHLGARVFFHTPHPLTHKTPSTLRQFLLVIFNILKSYIGESSLPSLRFLEAVPPCFPC